MTDMNSVKEPELLVVENMPLNGVHLIEASAGTGKTYNITRIYLRLLLEKKLTVDQILVMTFTNDATEEIRGRIDQTIRDSLTNWPALIKSDSFYQSIAEHIDENEVYRLLNKALLYLDEAAIFTIHGFCQRVLTQHAFATGLPFGALLQAEQRELTNTAVQDWYRQLAAENIEHFEKIAQFWPTPNRFIAAFNQVIGKSNQLTLITAAQLKEYFVEQVKTVELQLIAKREFLFEHLVDGKTPAQQKQRSEEFEQLLSWLSNCVEDYQHSAEKMPVAFADGRRFGKSPIKAELTEIFAPIKALKADAEKLLTEIARVNALMVARDGICSINQQIDIAKNKQNILTFDDLIKTLAYCLTSSDNANRQQLINLLRQQYPFALIDEFQDTDPEQFTIVNALYYHQKDLGLMMIGDPKQAIYGFRGGDIYTYMLARQSAQHQWIMNTNWRSTQSMIAGYNRLFHGNALSEPSSKVFGETIDYHPVHASPVAIERAQTVKEQTALNFIHMNVEGFGAGGKAVPQTQRSELATWCANKIVQLLSEESANGKSLNAQDIALLVRDGTEAKEVKQALQNAGIASVYLSDRTNLWHSEQAADLLIVLKAVLFFENERLFSAAMANDLMGYSPQQYYQLTNDELSWNELKFTFSELRNKWQRQGFITMALSLLHSVFKLSNDEGERALTNLLHLFELIQAASQQYHLPHELLFWFEQQIHDENNQQEIELRLESERDLIRIITQHGSKGLEYPVVFIPFATRFKNPLKFAGQSLSVVNYHNDAGEKVTSLYASDEEKQRMADEAYAETVRLLYVAVTRAEQQCFILSTDFDSAYLSPLGLTCQWDQSTNLVQSLIQMANSQADNISVEQINAPISPLVMQTNLQQTSASTISQFTGNIERDWWLSSYTALSRNVKDAGVSTPDRDQQNLALGITDAQTPSSHLLRFSLQKGAKTGNLLHNIFEHLNFSEPNWSQALHWPLLTYDQLGENEQGELIDWLNQTLNASLNVDKATTEIAQETDQQAFTLSNIPVEHTLREVEFYFPMENANVSQLTALVQKHRAQCIEKLQLSQIPQHMFIAGIKQLKGMMHGFIDLVFMHNGKYYLSDYKSTFLGDSFSDYHQGALLADIQQHHYDLQYLIYALALHRYLKHNLPDYQVEQHFGGVFYFYLRGMTNEAQYQGNGVYFTEISPEELNLLDALFGHEVERNEFSSLEVGSND